MGGGGGGWQGCVEAVGSPAFGSRYRRPALLMGRASDVLGDEWLHISVVRDHRRDPGFNRAQHVKETRELIVCHIPLAGDFW